MGTRRGMTNSPIELQKYLGGVDYPADMQALVDTAPGNGAEDDFVQSLQHLPLTIFDSPNDVRQAFGKK